jgi:hypothetical protein
MQLNAFDRFIWSSTNFIVSTLSNPFLFCIIVCIAFYHFYFPIHTQTELIFHIIIEAMLRLMNALLVYRAIKTIIIEKNIE